MGRIFLHAIQESRGHVQLLAVSLGSNCCNHFYERKRYDLFQPLLLSGVNHTNSCMKLETNPCGVGRWCFETELARNGTAQDLVPHLTVSGFVAVIACIVSPLAKPVCAKRARGSAEKVRIAPSR